jgi:HTH-type transcriptional regulator, glycine betaine synthesis regulator
MSRPPDQDPDEFVASAIGRLMAFWGFRRNLGRVWALLFLAPEAMTAAELCERLMLSTGSVSMALKELQSWGAVYKRHVPGDRREHYLAEPDIWKTITRVMEQREVREVDEVLEALENASRSADSQLAAATVQSDDATVDEQLFRKARIDELTELALAGKDLLDLVLGHDSVEGLVSPPPEQATEAERRRALRIPRAPLED